MFVASLRREARESKVTHPNLERIPRNYALHTTTPVNPVDVECGFTLRPAVLKQLLNPRCLVRKQHEVCVAELLRDLPMVNLHDLSIKLCAISKTGQHTPRLSRYIRRGPQQPRESRNECFDRLQTRRAMAPLEFLTWLAVLLRMAVKWLEDKLNCKGGNAAAVHNAQIGHKRT